MKSLLIVGQAPSRVMDENDPPLWGTTALTAMAKYAGVSPKERLYDLASFVNVIQRYPGPQLGNEKYDAYPNAEAREGWMGIKSLVQKHRPTTIVVLGSANKTMITKAEGLPREPAWFAKLRFSNDTTLYFSPHTGGTSMWWNDPKKRMQGQLFWRNIFSAQDRSQRHTDDLDEGPNNPIQQFNVR